MSTPGTEIEKDQAMSPQTPGSFHTQETVQQEKVFPQLPQRPPRPTRNRWFVVAAIGVLLMLILSIGAVIVAQWGQQPGGQVKPTPTVPGTTVTVTPGGTDTTPTPPSGVTPGPQPGPVGVKDPAHWDPIIGTQSGVNQVESVSFANLMDTPTLQALVTVRYTGTEARLDVYVFDNINSAKPTQIFKLTGLVKGDARISVYNTVMTAEVDKNSALNVGKSIANMKPDLFREFDWSSEEGTLVQTAFPGIFPDLTRYQAEADQARVNKGQDTWKNDPLQVAKAFEVKFFDWKRTVTAKLLSGGGPKDVSATVNVQEASVQGAQSQGPFIKVTLSRLEGNTHNMWVVIGVEDGTMVTLKNIEPRQLVASPVTLEGTGAAFEATIGRAVIFDHLYTDIGHAQVTALNAGFGKADYSTRVVYTTSFHQGVQEGLVAVYEDNGGISAEMYSVVMVKVLLDPEPGVALGPLPCPVKVKDPSYWNPFVSAPPDIQVADSVSCGNLLGKPSLQAMVVTREIVGGGPVFRSVYVFDKITDPKPQLLFKVGHLRHGEAAISGYSTIMTGEVDLNSPINKGKADTAVTVDLFREFQWSDGAGKFVQVAFPGIYPDLTRYQAEQDQRNVNAGQDTWKNDPAKVAKATVVKFFDWKRALTTKVLSGGGPQDVDATVSVQEAPLQGLRTGPSVNVTLSRLEGNTHNMWVVIGVADGSNFTLTNIVPRSLITSPVKLEGKGSAFEAEIGHGFVLDHLYTDIGHAILTATGSGMGFSPYATNVVYTSTFQGVQEGVVEVQQSNGGLSSDVATAVMVKVLLNPEQGVALGPLPCPDTVKDASHWNPILGLEGNTSGVLGVSCANMKGNPSLQAMVTVFHRDTDVQDVYVFDNITNVHPVQLFKLQGLYKGSALISGYSTVMTAEVDRNSSINQGKSGDQLTQDLFREFKWSEKAGTFVQVAFPGIYPDLTRWQAEFDQRNVNAGQDSWKNDAVKTTQHWNLIGGTAKLVKGGGPNDLTVVVNVTYPEPGGPTTNIPVTQVTLSRLEGNPNGIWEITSVGSDWLFIYTPKSGTTITSPVTVTGFGPQFEAQVGVVYILDHLYQKIQVGDNYAMVSDGSSPPSRFSLDVKYTSSIKGGAQEGIVELVHTSGASFAYGVVMVKVLINA